MSPRFPGGGDGIEGGEGEANAARDWAGKGGRREEGEGEAEPGTDRDRQRVEEVDDRGDDDSSSGREREESGSPWEGNGEAGSASQPNDTAGAVGPGAASPADDGNGQTSRTGTSWRRRRRPPHHRTIRGGVKASYVGPNVKALPVWGALDAIAGSSLLVDCRTPAQWRADEYRPTAQVIETR